VYYFTVLHRAVQYFKENWGAPFILAFLFCLIGSATGLSLGASGLANGFAICGFYFLVVGVALQIASYLKYGEAAEQLETRPNVRPTTSVRLNRRQKMLAAIAIAIVIVGVVSAYYIYNLPRVTVTPVLVTTVNTTVTGGVTATVASTSTLDITHTINPHQNFTPLTAAAGPAEYVSEPGGAVIIAFTISVQGGALPYNFVVNWGDGNVQNNTVGVFHRTFLNQTIPAFADVTVVSSDGQTASLIVEVPNP
jgi:hypothetical protein